jgi:hypothetical protein
MVRSLKHKKPALIGSVLAPRNMLVDGYTRSDLRIRMYHILITALTCHRVDPSQENGVQLFQQRKSLIYPSLFRMKKLSRGVGLILYPFVAVFMSQSLTNFLAQRRAPYRRDSSISSNLVIANIQHFHRPAIAAMDSLCFSPGSYPLSHLIGDPLVHAFLQYFFMAGMVF